MKIFYTATILGGREMQPLYKKTVELLGKYGTVMPNHVADPDISKFGETNLTKKEIHDREVDYLQQSDVVVADISLPSLGVGYLVARAVEAGKSVLGLYHGENTYALSAMIQGDTKIEVALYNNAEDLETVLEKKIKK